MKFVYQVACGGCSYRSQVIWPLWACYRLPSEHTLEVAQQLCWCNGCESVTQAESVTELKHIEQLQALPIIKDAYVDERKVWTQNEEEAVLQYTRYPRFAHLYEAFSSWKRWDVRQCIVMKNSLALHREWRLLRTSPPRCMSCGSTDFIPFAADDHGEPESGLHPSCGGTLSLTKMHKALRVKRCLWTHEGERLGVG